MSNSDLPASSRRGFLKLIGGSVVLLPMVGMSGCSGDDSQPTAGTPAQPAKDSQATPPAKPAAGLPRVAEDDPTATALGYRHDAADVDAARYPQRAANQLCRNCSLFQANGEQQWAPCTIFPGKAVNADGWCTAWASAG